MSTPACRFCRHVNPAGAKFCNECGSPLHLRPCPTCEAITDAAAQACHQCGTSFADDGAVTPMMEAPPGEGAAQKDRRHVPESLAECLDTRAASLAPFVRMPDAGGGSKAPLPAGGEPADHHAPPASDMRRVPVGDGDEMIADDALAPSSASHEEPGVVESTHADDDLPVVVMKVANSGTGERAPEPIPEVPPIRGPDAAERPVTRAARTRAARGNPVHPVAWAVVLAALGGAGYYAYAERARWTPWLADVTAIVRGGAARTAQDASVGPAGDGKSAIATTPAPSASSPAATSTGVAERGAGNASSAGVAPDATAGPATHEAPANVRTTAPQAASGDAATAIRAAETSRAPTAARPGTPATAATARPDTPQMATSAAADTGASKARAPKAATTKASTARRDDAAKTVDTTKPTKADALATRRLIERELGDFLPPDGKRPPQNARPAE